MNGDRIVEHHLWRVIALMPQVRRSSEGAERAGRKNSTVVSQRKGGGKQWLMRNHEPLAGGTERHYTVSP